MRSKPNVLVWCTGPRIFPGMIDRVFWRFDDPAKSVGAPEATLAEFRRVRDEIRVRILRWLHEIAEEGARSG